MQVIDQSVKLTGFNISFFSEELFVSFLTIVFSKGLKLYKLFLFMFYAISPNGTQMLSQLFSNLLKTSLPFYSKSIIQNSSNIF